MRSSYDSSFPTTDQCGATRPLDGNGDGDAQCDLGSYEADAVPPTVTPPSIQAPIMTPTVTGAVTVTETSVVTPTVTTISTTGDELFSNGGFETDTKTGEQDLSPWTLKNAVGDRIRCNTAAKTFAYEGQCAFMMKGSPSEKMTLMQTVDLADFSVAAGDTLRLSL